MLFLARISFASSQCVGLMQNLHTRLTLQHFLCCFIIQSISICFNAIVENRKIAPHFLPGSASHNSVLFAKSWTCLLILIAVGVQRISPVMIQHIINSIYDQFLVLAQPICRWDYANISMINITYDHKVGLWDAVLQVICKQLAELQAMMLLLVDWINVHHNRGEIRKVNSHDYISCNMHYQTIFMWFTHSVVMSLSLNCKLIIFTCVNYNVYIPSA